MTSSHRRNPDDLLDALKRSGDSERGQLRVFLGMCPGVGKTFSMLEAARQQAKRGVQVVVGVVETHGRKETEALLDGLTILPRKDIWYKETALQEMDLDRILEERPTLVLVDELAHTNAPGSRHLKRYQDVEELLSAGVDVYTTLNIQHVESRTDQVAQITGVIVRETVPDSFLELADQIEVVDLSPAELLQRLSEGRVYLGDRAARAAEGFFKEEHLLALRELSLRFVAERVDQDLHDQMTIKGIEGPWNTNERLLVAISHSPYSARLIRTTRRMAYNLEAPWIALHVNTGESLTQEDEETLQKNMSLARDLGAEVIAISDRDIAYAIQKVSRDYNVTQIVMGRPDRRLLKDLFSQGTLLDKLVRETSRVDVHVIRAERKPRYRAFFGQLFKWPEFKTGFFPYYNTAWFMLAIAFLCRALVDVIGYRALGSIFLLAILAVASFAGAGPTLFSALFAAFIWNFFFIPPTWTFSITSPEDYMMVASFFVAALVGGLLTARVRKHETVLERRESETRALYELIKRLADATEKSEVAERFLETVRRLFKTKASILLVDGQGQHPAQSFGATLEEKEAAIAQWSFENGRAAGWSTQTLSAGRCLCMPMKGNARVVGVAAFFPPTGLRTLSIEDSSLLETMITQTAIVLERLELGAAAETAHLLEASERLHQTLLNSVSHELRTPLTTLIGAASALSDEQTSADPATRQSLTDEIVQSSRRLDRVVENLLDVSRLEKGSLQLKREWFEIGELITSVLNGTKDEASPRSITASGNMDVLCEGDFQLLDHALTQLVVNALKYSKSETPIDISVEESPNAVKIIVRDEGPGIAESLKEKLFEKFFRAPGSPTGGIGLGLSIVKNIIELHGGKARARNRSDGLGAEFEMELPLKSPPDQLKEALV